MSKIFKIISAEDVKFKKTEQEWAERGCRLNYYGALNTFCNLHHDYYTTLVEYFHEHFVQIIERITNQNMDDQLFANIASKIDEIHDLIDENENKLKTHNELTINQNTTNSVQSAVSLTKTKNYINNGRN